MKNGDKARAAAFGRIEAWKETKSRNGGKKMGRYIRFTVLALCVIVLVTDATTEATSIDYTQVAEDIDIMAKIIDKALGGKFPDEYKTASLFTECRGSQGIYLNGYGALFMTSISFPVAERTVTQEETTPDDLWQRTKYELTGGRGLVSAISFANRGAGKSYDSQKVEQLKEELLRLIGTYAPNIRPLGPQENVVIAVRGTSELFRINVLPSQHEMDRLKEKVEEIREEAEQLRIRHRNGVKYEVRSSSPTSPKGTEAAVVVAQEAAAPGTPKMTAEVWAPMVGKYVAMSDRSDTGRTTLIVKANKEDIVAYKDGKLDFDGFMERAEVTQY